MFLSYTHLFLNLVCVCTQERSGHQSSKEHGKGETSGEKKAGTRTIKWWNTCGLKADRTICRAVMGPARAHKGAEPTDGLMGAHRDQGTVGSGLGPLHICYGWVAWSSPQWEWGTVSDPFAICGVLSIYPWRDGMCLIFLEHVMLCLLDVPGRPALFEGR